MGFLLDFCLLLPKVYSNDLLSQIKIIVTDGDAQESSQIDNTIDLFFRKLNGFNVVGILYIRDGIE